MFIRVSEFDLPVFYMISLLKMKKKILFLLILVIHQVSAQTDKEATLQTRNLFKNLKKLSKKGVMFGQQDALAYGLNQDGSRWIGENKRCDVRTVTGDYPAVVGYDLGKLEHDSTQNLDGVPFQLIRQNIQETYARGVVNTISWHLDNPSNPKKSSWDKADSTIKHIFSDNKTLQTYSSWLDKVAAFSQSLRGKNGELIPIIFRPFHENTGSWFWWGAEHCSPEEYKKLWRFTVEYLRDKKGVHNILYAYSPDYFSSKQHYLDRFPGDDLVDVLGFDMYHRNAPESNDAFKKDMLRMVGHLKEIADEKKKVYAITEMGLEKVTEANWWTNIVSPIIQNSGLSYVLVWRNGRPDHFYAPYKGQISESDFMKFYQLPETLFSKDVKKLYK
jgi:mannan endo-1,4-beta-mannosidase